MKQKSLQEKYEQELKKWKEEFKEDELVPREEEPKLEVLKCPKKKCSEQMRIQKAGRLVRNIIDTFEFETNCGCEGVDSTTGYESLKKHLVNNCLKVKNFKCCDIQMTKTEFQEHLNETCTLITGECKFC